MTIPSEGDQHLDLDYGELRVWVKFDGEFGWSSSRAYSQGDVIASLMRERRYCAARVAAADRMLAAAQSAV